MPAPVGGDPSKPGAWTPRQIADWEARKGCTHSAFLADRRPHEDTCPACGLVVVYRSEEPDYEQIRDNRLAARHPYTD